MHRIQFIFDLRTRIAFQNQIFNDTSLLDFVLNSLERLSHNNRASKMTETLVSNRQLMNNEIHYLSFTSAAIFMLWSETFQTTLVVKNAVPFIQFSPFDAFCFYFSRYL